MTQSIERAAVRVCIGLGSNIEPKRHIESGLVKLAERVQISALSGLYRSPALDHPEQPDYLNGVVAIDTTLDPRTLKFDVLRKIEEEEGRVRTEDRFAPRTLDMDILLYGGEELDREGVLVPDPGVRERAFLLKPLLEVALPDMRWPGTGERLHSLSMPPDAATLWPDVEFTAHLRQRIFG